MRDAHGLEIGGGIQEAGKGGVSNKNAAQQNDVDEMQRKLDQLKHLWTIKIIHLIIS